MSLSDDVTRDMAPRPARAELRLRVGDVVAGRYRIVRDVAAGGQGHVYVARDAELDVDVALKTLHGARASDDLAVDRFKREVRLARAVTHPNVCRIHDLGRHREGARWLLFLTMELVPGPTLTRRLAERGPMSTEEALPLLHQMAAGLAAAHVAGVVHRDFKSCNVIVDPGDGEPRAVITDFGISCLSDDPGVHLRAAGAGAAREVDPEADTVADAIVGTPAYMAPEQLLGEAIGPAADVYALGIVIYEMLTGLRPFRDDTAMNVAVQRLERRAPRLADAGIAADERWEQVVARCLARKASDRFAGALDVVEALSADGPSPLAVARPSRVAAAAAASPATSFVERPRLQGELDRALADTRLVSLVGVGGCGKTRLASSAVERAGAARADGAVWVALESVTDPAAVASRVASALGATDQGLATAADAVLARLADRELLLVLDNCEHLLDACARLAERIVAQAPGVTLLATSREPLSLGGEMVVQVPPMTVPEADDRESVEASEAGRLFVERARAARPGFRLDELEPALVAALTRRLDGLPLALELAAARVALLSVEQILERVDRRFALLVSPSRSGLPRHQTLRAVIDWSYGQLSSEEQRLFRALAVFGGGFTLEAAEAIVPGEGDDIDVLNGLGHLTAKSLVSCAHGADGARFSLLETLRAYAAERLAESGEADEVRARHAAHYAAFGERAAPRLVSADQREWMARLDAEWANVEAALDAYDRAGDAGPGLRLASAMWRYWDLRGRGTDGRARLARLLDRAGESASSEERAAARYALGAMAAGQGELDAQRENHETARVLFEELGDARGAAACLHSLGNVASEQGDLALASDLYGRARDRFREIADERGEAISLYARANLELFVNRTTEAAASFRETLALARRMGDERMVGFALYGLGITLDELDELDAAREVLEESLALRRSLGDERGIAYSARGLGRAALRRGELERAGELLDESLHLAERIDDRAGIAHALSDLGRHARARGELEAARTHMQREAGYREDVPDPRGRRVLLESLVCQLIAEGSLEEGLRCAAALTAAIEPSEEHTGDRAMRGELVEATSRARSVLDATTAADAEREGATWTADEALRRHLGGERVARPSGMC